MDSRELRILKEIEANTYEEDEEFAERIAGGPRLSVPERMGLSLATGVGIALLMAFPTNLLLGLAGYLVLVSVAMITLRRRRIQPVERSPLDTFHHFTAGLLRNPDTASESSYG